MAGNTLMRSAAAASIGMAALLSVACQKDSGPAPASQPTTTVKAPPPVKKGPTPEELTAGMVQAAPQDKSILNLDLKFDLANRPQVGRPLDFNLAVISQGSSGPLTLQISNSNGFAPPDASAFDIPDVEPGEVYRHTFRMTPRSEGLLLVGITVSMKHDDITDTKLFAIPVIVDAK